MATVEKRERLTGRYVESPFFARLIEILPADKKAKVRRTYMGANYDILCSYTQTVKDGFLSGTIVIGDIMLVVFVEGNIHQPLIIAKIII